MFRGLEVVDGFFSDRSTVPYKTIVVKYKILSVLILAAF